MIRVPRPAASLAAVLVLACVPTKTDTTDATTDASDSAGSTSLAPTTGEFACIPGPIAGEHTCNPAGPADAHWVLMDIGAFTDIFDETCTLVAVDDDGTVQTLELDCPSDSLELFLTTSSPHVPLAVTAGATLHLQYKSIPNGEIWYSGYFMLSDDQDTLLVAGVNGPAAPLTLGPLTYDIRSTTCEGFGDPCSVTQRAALEVTLDGESAVVFDGYAGKLGVAPAYQLLVEHVSREDCSTDDFSRPDCTSPNNAAWSVYALFIRLDD